MNEDDTELEPEFNTKHRQKNFKTDEEGRFQDDIWAGRERTAKTNWNQSGRDVLGKMKIIQCVWNIMRRHLENGE